MDYYEEFGIPRSASQREIRSAWKRLARFYHPDLQTDPEMRETAELEMRRLNHMLSVLTDPRERIRYDLMLEVKRNAPSAPPLWGPSPVRTNGLQELLHFDRKAAVWLVGGALASGILALGAIALSNLHFGTTADHAAGTSVAVSNPPPALPDTIPSLESRISRPGAKSLPEPSQARANSAAKRDNATLGTAPPAPKPDLTVVSAKPTVAPPAAQPNSAPNVAKANFLPAFVKPHPPSVAEPDLASAVVQPDLTASTLSVSSKTSLERQVSEQSKAPVALAPPIAGPAGQAELARVVEVGPIPTASPASASASRTQLAPATAPALPVPAPHSAEVMQPAKPAAGLTGLWRYNPGEQTDQKPGFYAADRVEMGVSDESGVLRGYYTAHYLVPAGGISPDVAFKFSGEPGRDTATGKWLGANGNQGEIRLRVLSNNALEVVWVTTRMKHANSLVSGKITLSRAN
jgi:hypothetical protein